MHRLNLSTLRNLVLSADAEDIHIDISAVPALLSRSGSYLERIEIVADRKMSLDTIQALLPNLSFGREESGIGDDWRRVVFSRRDV